jgi:hypothetical protein
MLLPKNYSKDNLFPENFIKMGGNANDVSRIRSGFHYRAVNFSARMFDLQKSRFSSGLGRAGVFACLRFAPCFYAVGVGAVA